MGQPPLVFDGVQYQLDYQLKHKDSKIRQLNRMDRELKPMRNPGGKAK